MGTCASIQLSKTQNTLLITNGSSSSTTMVTVINAVTGELEEFRQPVTARNILSDQSNTFFLCNSETMFVNCHMQHVSGEEQLQPGQIYFLMPVEKSNKVVSLHELCLLAIKASFAIEKNKMKKGSGTSTTSFSDRRKNGNRSKRSKSNQKVDFQLALKQLA